MLRRYRRRNVPEAEVAGMRYARERGFPVPEVFEVSGRDMVMERVDGPTMQEVLERDVSQLDRQIRTLAALHERLHTIAAPAGLSSVGPGGTLLHLDLHPKNVILGTDGPCVIDWANAAAGHWADDVAQTIVVIWSARVDQSLVGIIDHFVEIFLAAFDRGTVRAHVPAAVARRIADANVTDAEREMVRGLSL